MATPTKKSQPAATQSSPRKLEDHAANAALYATKNISKPNKSILDEAGKLSSASAATSLKYAKPHELPSYPSPGLEVASAGAAASLAESNRKPVEIWRPSPQHTAEKAAARARDYEPEPAWQPESNSAGSMAASLATDRSASVNVYRPKESGAGLSAAEMATRKPIAPPVDHRAVPADSSRKALMAATGAMASSRKRADSAPINPASLPSRTSSTADWAMKAATQSQREPRSTDSPAGTESRSGVARVHNIAQSNVSRQMYTSHPPVSLEVEEKNRQDTIRASAVAMAQTMYAVQQKAASDAKTDISKAESRYAARNVHNRKGSDASSQLASPSPHALALSGNGLQEAAQRLAQERLDKLRDEGEEYKQYYGQKTPATKSRMSMPNKLRRRASSDGAIDENDREQSRKIRSQMSTFRSNLAAVDEPKRKKDRDALLAAAQRNVKASMHTMDEEVFEETGKSSPAQREEWATKARNKAQAESDSRMENHGKLHIGSGKYMEQADVDAIARSRIQPTLDDITDKAETQRARETEAKMEQERESRRVEAEKQRSIESKAELKKTRDEEKQQEKSKRENEKRTHKEEMTQLKAKEKAEKEEKKAKTRTEKNETKEKQRLEAEEARKSKDRTQNISSPRPADIDDTSNVTADDDEHPASSEGRLAATRTSTTSSESLQETKDDEEKIAEGKTTEEDSTMSPALPSKRASRVRSWFAGKFNQQGKAGKELDEKGNAKTEPTGSEPNESEDDSATADKTRDGSVRDVAMAGKPSTVQATTDRQADRSVSPLEDGRDSKSEDEESLHSMSTADEGSPEKKDDPSRGRLGFMEKLMGKAPTEPETKPKQPKSENGDEGHDSVESEKLAPPKIPVTSPTSNASASPVRDSKFSELL